jgi:hypothetical protein
MSTITIPNDGYLVNRIYANTTECSRNSTDVYQITAWKVGCFRPSRAIGNTYYETIVGCKVSYGGPYTTALVGTCFTPTTQSVCGCQYPAPDFYGT